MNKVVLISSTPPPMGGIAKWTERMLKETLPDGWHIVLVDDKIVGKRVPLVIIFPMIYLLNLSDGLRFGRIYI